MTPLDLFDHFNITHEEGVNSDRERERGRERDRKRDREGAGERERTLDER